MKKDLSEAQMKKRIDAYFASRRTAARNEAGEILRNKAGEIVYEEKMPTITGLALALDCTSREALSEFEEENKKALVLRALLKIEESAEEKLFSKDSFSGTKLFLETNFPRWREGGESEEAPDLSAFPDWTK